MEQGKKVTYTFECIQCGECCKIPTKIIVSKQDIVKWREKNLQGYLECVQICPTTFSPVKLRELTEDKRDELINFILTNHTFRGEGDGFLIDRPYINRNWSSRPILSPKEFETVITGIKLGLEYIILNELTGKCHFLKDNSCSIQELKPSSCKLFPYDRKNQIRVNKRILEVCTGIKKSEED